MLSKFLLLRNAPSPEGVKAQSHSKPTSCLYQKISTTTKGHPAPACVERTNNIMYGGGTGEKFSLFGKVNIERPGIKRMIIA